MSPIGACKLCRRDGVALRKSHVIPNFVIQWMRESSVGFMRDGTNVDRRIQDGPKFPWLCDDCEQRLSAWENPFAETVFSYVHKASEKQDPIPYGPWALKFAVSISWRALLFNKQQPDYDLTGENAAAADRAQEHWRRFLLDEEPHPGPFEQHVLCVDAPLSASGPISPFMSRYLTRAIGLDLPTSPTSCLTYAKLCRVIIFGFVRESEPRKWRGTKLHVNKGLIGGTAHVPGAILHYLNEKASEVSAGVAGMSARQSEKVADVLRNADPEKLLASEAFRAITADFALTRRNE